MASYKSSYLVTRRILSNSLHNFSDTYKRKLKRNKVFMIYPSKFVLKKRSFNYSCKFLYDNEFISTRYSLLQYY